MQGTAVDITEPAGRQTLLKQVMAILCNFMQLYHAACH